MKMLWPLRAAFAVLGRVAPGLAARWALDLFFTPRGRRGSRRVSAFLVAGRPFAVRVDGLRVAGWSWGRGPNVFLVHGWAGVGGQLAAFGPPLLANGFRVVTFDAPGHGASEGRRSSIVHFAKALKAVAASEGEPVAVIAHSLGAAATLRALSQGLKLERVVFLGPTRGPRDWAEQFRRQLGVPRPVMTAMRERSERWLGASWEDFDVPRMAGGQTAPLLASGFRVVTFDAPGHGASTGRRSSIVHFAGALQEIAAKEGPAHAVIAHSLGAAAVVRALSQGLEAGRAVFVGPTGGPRDWAERFRRHLGVPPHVMTSMRERSERWLGASWADFDVPMLAVKQAAPLLIFHDRDDAEVPWSDGAAIAKSWPGARLATTSGLGHRRILRDERVVSQAVAFVKGEPVDTRGWANTCRHPGCDKPAREDGLCDSCGLEASLYLRDERRDAWATTPGVS